MRIAIITNIIPTYREHFYDVILNDSRFDVKVFCQDKQVGENIKSIHKKYGDRVHLLKSYSPFNDNSLVLQFLPIFDLFKNYDIFVVDGNLRHVSQAFLSMIFKLLGKKIIIWSNVQTFGGNRILQKLRLTWWKIFDNFLMYTDKDVCELDKLGFKNKNIISINNGLNQNFINNQIKFWNEEKLSLFKQQHKINSNNIIISSGRINIINQHDLTIEAVKSIKIFIPDILWIVIGNGSELERLKKKSKVYNLKNNICFLGEVYEEEEKCPWFLISKGFVHPGPIGLSLLNAYGYSLPVITHNSTNNHGPEFSLFEDNKTGYLFEYRNCNDLVSKIIFLINNKTEVKKIRQNIFEIANFKNNTSVMADQFFNMIKLVN